MLIYLIGTENVFKSQVKEEQLFETQSVEQI